MAAEAFDYVQSRGGLGRKQGQHFRDTVLSKGNSQNPMKTYLDFVGKKPGIMPYLLRMGLVSSEPAESGK